MPFSELPVDVILALVEALPKADIASMCTVCHDMQQIAEHVLYRSFYLRGESVKAFTADVLRITRYPWRAASIRTLHIPYHVQSFEWERFDPEVQLSRAFLTALNLLESIQKLVIYVVPLGRAGKTHPYLDALTALPCTYPALLRCAAVFQDVPRALLERWSTHSNDFFRCVNVTECSTGLKEWQVDDLPPNATLNLWPNMRSLQVSSTTLLASLQTRPLERLSFVCQPSFMDELPSIVPFSATLRHLALENVQAEVVEQVLSSLLYSGRSRLSSLTLLLSVMHAPQHYAPDGTADRLNSLVLSHIVSQCQLESLIMGICGGSPHRLLTDAFIDSAMRSCTSLQRIAYQLRGGGSLRYDRWACSRRGISGSVYFEGYGVLNEGSWRTLNQVSRTRST